MPVTLHLGCSEKYTALQIVCRDSETWEGTKTQEGETEGDYRFHICGFVCAGEKGPAKLKLGGIFGSQGVLQVILKLSLQSTQSVATFPPSNFPDCGSA